MSQPPPITLHRPARWSTGIVLTSPHSGRRYPKAFLESSRLDERAIRGSEDSFIDRLFADGPELGLPLLAAEFPRAWCDVNREPWELDPAMFADALPPHVNTASPRVAAGLGTLARVVGNGEAIYARKLAFAEAKERIENCWRPFHETLAGLIEESLDLFGHCLVLDCHSMPTPRARLGPRCDIVLGDGHGTACRPEWSRRTQLFFEELGFTVRRNDPYAGGFITRHYGRPREKVEVIQIEISRGLYMDEQNFTDRPGFDTLRATLTRFMERMIAANRLGGAMDFGFSAAAE
ncbi:N-formylglutamate amidohydrolase [Acidocella sp.]|uniref:N-formylglutamate amidohydrolase n=1 Tax=Acidocella sp. TaxID=50710 RepID=UPI002629ABC5|nr:N-formylglutamate amidohydrolase [Acidocella sp.]